MTENILKNCKKYIIHTIINPSLYWMSEYNDDKCYEAHKKQFENLSPNFIEKIPACMTLSAGKMVAVFHNRGFHRGLLTDIFHKHGQVNYSVLLVASGVFIETKKENLFLIKDDDIANLTPTLFEVSIYGIQPATLEISCERFFTSGTFQKKKCNYWSAFASQFVKELFDDNPVVFVKSIGLNRAKMIGEIYLVSKTHGSPISLSQMLCDKGFAVFTAFYNEEGDEDNVIKDKIPKEALKLEN